MRLETLCIIAFLAVVAFGTPAIAQDFRVYPGSKIDQAAGHQASTQASGAQCEVYTSADSFDKIYGFYKGLYREAPTPLPTQKLPDGENIKWAFFILDQGKDLSHSQYWMKIQRPYIGTIGDGDLDFKDIRNVSVIQTIHKHLVRTVLLRPVAGSKPCD